MRECCRDTYPTLKWVTCPECGRRRQAWNIDARELVPCRDCEHKRAEVWYLTYDQLRRMF